MEIKDASTIALDISSKTSVFLTKIIVREFVSSEPVWIDSEPDIEKMLNIAEAALLIGDPAFTLDREKFRVYDIVELWREYTGFGFVFAMWMTRQNIVPINLAAVRDEGMRHIEDIAQNYCRTLNVSPAEMADYLKNNISYSISEDMQKGLQLYIELASKCGLIEKTQPLRLIDG